VQRLLKSRIERYVQGPDAQERARSGAQFWGRASDGSRSVEMTMSLLPRDTLSPPRRVWNARGACSPARLDQAHGRLRSPSAPASPPPCPVCGSAKPDLHACGSRRPVRDYARARTASPDAGAILAGAAQMKPPGILLGREGLAAPLRRAGRAAHRLPGSVGREALQPGAAGAAAPRSARWDDGTWRSRSMHIRSWRASRRATRPGSKPP